MRAVMSVLRHSLPTLLGFGKGSDCQWMVHAVRHTSMNGSPARTGERAHPGRPDGAGLPDWDHHEAHQRRVLRRPPHRQGAWQRCLQAPQHTSSVLEQRRACASRVA